MPYPTHGMSHSPTWNSWRSMMARCYNPNNNRYKLYGKRGISVQKSWHKFSNFLKDMGVRPHGLTIDRVNNNGDYSKKNCRWSDRKTQCRNRRTSVFVEYKGKKKTIAEWSEITGISQGTLQRRIYLGWKPKDILTKPVRPVFWKKNA